MHPRFAAGARRLGPSDAVPREEKGSLRVTAVDDPAVTGPQVVHVDGRDSAGAGPLNPRRDPVQHVGRPQGTVPEFAAGRSRGGTDLRHPSRTPVPGPDGEIAEACERVVLGPDQPAAVEDAAYLILRRVRKSLDRIDCIRS